MKKILTVAVAALFFITCNFETDGNFAGQVAGIKKNEQGRLLPPANVRVSEDVSGGIQIVWDGSEQADGYTVYRAYAEDAERRFVRRGSASGTGYTDCGASVPPGIDFYYQVAAYNGTGVSAPSAAAGPVSARPNAVILSAPDITGASVNVSDIQLNWTAVSGAQGYILYRASAYDGSVYIFLITTTTPLFVDDGLPRGSYYYQVRAYNADGEGYISAPYGPVLVQSGGQALPVPAKPQNLRAMAEYSTEAPGIAVSWNAAANADSYSVYRSLDDERYEEITRTTSTSYKDTAGLQNGDAYYYRVRGYNGIQEGYLSDSCGPVLLRPGKPEITVSVVDRSVNIEWDAIHGADTYYVSRSANGAQYQTITSRGITAVTYSDIGLSAGTWYYRVEASNAAGKGLPSESRQVTVIVNVAVPVISVQPVGATYLMNVPATALFVQASASDGGALSYQWFKNADNANSGGTAISGATNASYVPPTSAAGTLYYYVVVTNTNNSANGNTTATTASNTAAVTVLGGSGQPEIVVPTGGSIIHISTQAGLESIRNHIDDPQYNYGKNAYVLDNDITLSGTWTPIGYVETVNVYGDPTGGLHAFSGNFYGNGHTIRNLILLGGSIHYIGLFGYINEALIDGLQVELGEMAISVTNNTAQEIGIIAGVHKNSTIKNCGVYSSLEIVINGSSGRSVDFSGISCSRGDGVSSIIENCYVSMNVTITSGTTHIVIDGIVNNTNNIRNCYYIGTITGNGLYVDSYGVGYSTAITQMSYSAGAIINNATGSEYTHSGGVSIGSMSNCATMMERINLASGSNYGRIQSPIGTGTLTNNYAYSGMLLNGSAVTSNDPNGQNGLDKTAAELKQRSTYETGLGWDFNNVWEMGPSTYPFPILKWQNGVVKLPQGFKVIGESETVPLNASSAGEFATALSAVQNGQTDTNYVITVTADLNLAPQSLTLAAYKDKTVTLKGNAPARKITLSGNGSLFTVGTDTELVLENIALQGKSDNNASLVTVDGGKLALKSGGKVTGNTYTTAVNNSGGAGVFVDGGTLEIAGGEVSGNTMNGTVAGVDGGGIRAINNSTILMNGGAIRDNHVICIHYGDGGSGGGGMFINNNSSFEMIDGYIENNSVNDQGIPGNHGAHGGGVFIVDNSSFYLRGGKIRQNTANGVSSNNYGEANGGGILCGNGSEFIMSGGIVSGNSCTSAVSPNYSYSGYYEGAYGGGVGFGWNINSFIKTGGTIYGNEVNGNDANGIPLKNTAQSDSGGNGGGHAVNFLNPNYRRNTTAYETDNLDSSVSGSAGGWE